MAGSKYSKRRRIVQTLSVLALASIPLRIFCVDLESDVIRFYGMEFGMATMFYPLFAVVGVLMYVVFLSMKKGRIFCSHMCPMHMFLEIVNSPTNKKSDRRPALVWLLGTAFSLFLTEVILSFFQPITRQVTLISEGNWALIGIGSAIFLGFMGLLIHYQEHFCKRGCPYALIQMLLQSDSTRYMKFSNAEKSCTNCRGCDDICPFNLRARFESQGPDCTNCNLCSEACTNELGEGNTLFRFEDPQPELSAEQ